MLVCILGAVQMLEELTVQFDILDDTMAFESYRLIIVPEDIVASVAVQKKMDAYVQTGGRILASGKGGILSAVAPYFKREGDKFCSHSYTPSAKGQPYPAAIQSGNVILFAHPLFTQYRNNTPRWVKQLVKNALDLPTSRLPCAA